MKPQKPVKLPLRKSPGPTSKRKRQPATRKVRARAASIEPEEADDYEDYEEEAEPNMKFSHALFVVLILHVIAVGGVFAFNSIKARQAALSPAEPPAGASALPASEETASSVATTGPTGPRVHTVEKGETLTAIARKYSTTIQAIERANGMTTYSLIRVGQELHIPDQDSPAGDTTTPPAVASVPTSPSRIDPPQSAEGKLTSRTRTPPAMTPDASHAPVPSVAKVPGAKSVPSTGSQSGDGVYVVVKGDNPYSIAKRLEVSYTDLLELNGIDDPTKLQIGQKLKVPGR